jgi:ABC-type multidrug transport system fused ATPase/permease subunit
MLHRFDLGGHDILHDALLAVVDLMGRGLEADLPAWLHPVLHVVLIWAPLTLVLILSGRIVSFFRRWHERRRLALAPTTRDGFEPSVIRYIIRHSGRAQLGLMALGLATMPVLYATFELPKEIINNAIDSQHFPIAVGPFSLGQVEYLLALSLFFLLAHLLSSGLKYCLNVQKGRVGERVLRRLRLTIFGHWRRGAGGPKRSEVIPLLAQETEPIGGFAAEVLAQPVFQGGTFLTILAFMFVQDPILGAAAVTLLPVQLAIIPILQRRINRLARRRVAEMRALGGELGDQAAGYGTGRQGVRTVASAIRNLQAIRQDTHRVKFLMKSLNNFLSALTPFFLYSIGGYLVIDGRLSLGALIAVLAAYKDLSAPLRELFTYYQQAEDVRIRYAEMLAYLRRSDNDAAATEAVYEPPSGDQVARSATSSDVYSREAPSPAIAPKRVIGAMASS